MLSAKMLKALNEQINAEMYSSYLYLGMSAWLKDINLRGAAHWMSEQAKEETGHAMKLYGYVYERLGRVTLAAIDAPPATWKSPLEAFQAAFKHEQKVTGMIGKLVEMAAAEKDHATVGFLQWFIKEQVEEEASSDEVVQMLKAIGDAAPAMFMLDAHLGRRGS